MLIGELYAKKGDIVTCENEHPVLEIQVDIFKGETENPETQFEFFEDQIEPMIGTEYFQCLCHCGKMYIRQALTRCGNFSANTPELHFKDGWR